MYIIKHIPYFKQNKFLKSSFKYFLTYLVLKSAFTLKINSTSNDKIQKEEELRDKGIKYYHFITAECINFYTQ